mmetsp:Transcript_54553/g.111304  ORF Transcript_54553/g.111304 Transcript_54553/m.111304 type:complete len:253 (-) Transcript_54553:374-1132(-)
MRWLLTLSLFVCTAHAHIHVVGARFGAPPKGSSNAVLELCLCPLALHVVQPHWQASCFCVIKFGSKAAEGAPPSQPHRVAHHLCILGCEGAVAHSPPLVVVLHFHATRVRVALRQPDVRRRRDASRASKNVKASRAGRSGRPNQSEGTSRAVLSVGAWIARGASGTNNTRLADRALLSHDTIPAGRSVRAITPREPLRPLRPWRPPLSVKLRDLCLKVHNVCFQPCVSIFLNVLHFPLDFTHRLLLLAKQLF